jgi:hypothetical protein
MQANITRRSLLKAGIMAGTLVPALGLVVDSASAAPASAAPGDLPPLDPATPQAATLGFVNDTSKVSAAASPKHAADQNCANCNQWLGDPKAARGGCVLFPGKSVPANGWCKVWRLMPQK